MPQVGKEQRAKYRVSTAHMMPWNCRKGKAVLVEILILLQIFKRTMAQNIWGVSFIPIVYFMQYFTAVLKYFQELAGNFC